MVRRDWGGGRGARYVDGRLGGAEMLVGAEMLCERWTPEECAGRRQLGRRCGHGEWFGIEEVDAEAFIWGAFEFGEGVWPGG